jgi:O-antigen/teichoic acid export membrane protein/glycosyltransferase involved in cell wall biosynthesis
VLEVSASRPLRVLFVQPFAKAGGAENVLLRLLAELDPDRIQPRVVLMEPGPFSEELDELGVPWRVTNLPGKLVVPLFPFRAKRLARDLAGEDIDVIHANGTKAAMFSLTLARNLGAPLLWMKHGHDFDSWAPRVIGPGCDRIACVSSAVAATFPAKLQSRVFVCTPGVELHDLTPIAGTKPLIVSAGRIDPLKGFDELIRATALLRERGVDAQLEIAGPVNPKSPNHGRQLERLIAQLNLEGDARLLGRLETLEDLYSRARVVALASRLPKHRRGNQGVEGTPLVLLEGMAASRPVVGPNDAGIAEIVGDEAGRLAPEARASDLADAMEPFLRDVELAERAGRAGRERVEASYTLTAMAECLEEEYVRLAGGDDGPDGGFDAEGPAPDEPDPAPAGSFGSSRRVARNTAARWTGELIAKTASVAFYVVMARELGTADFGSFIFALSISSVVLIGAGFGLDQLLAREVSRDREVLEDLVGDVLAIKSVMLCALLGGLVGVLALGPYDGTVMLAASLIGVGVGIEMLTQTLHAVTQAYERMELGAIGLVVQRGVTALVGIGVLLAGGGLVAAAVVFAVGSLVGYLVSDLAMRRAVSPAFRLDRARWGRLARAGAPIGAATLLFTLLLRLDASLISFLTGGDQSEVGYYGAAYRLIDATLFTGISFSAAMLPWIARQSSDDSPQLARGAALGFKLLTAALLPVALTYIVFAPEIVELFYGPQYEPSVEVTQLLGAMTVLYALNWFASNLLIARHRPGAFARAIGVTVVVNVGLNLWLIPADGASGAALAALISGGGLAAYSVWLVRDTLSAVSLVRSFAGPLLAAAAFLAVALLLPLPAVPAIVAALAAYVTVLAAFELYLYADDFALVRNVAERAAAMLRRRPGPVDPEPTKAGP